MSQSQYESRPRHPLRDRRPWLQLAPFLLPFLLLAGMTIEQAELRPPPRTASYNVVRADLLRRPELIGTDSIGRAYFFDQDRGLYAFGQQGELCWILDHYGLFAGEMFSGGYQPKILRLQQQTDANVVFETADGPLICVDLGGAVRWKFDPRTLSPDENGAGYREVRLLTPPEQVPPFTCWHDNGRTLYALDYNGNLLWTTEAWPCNEARRGFPQDNYGDKDNWADGSMLVTVRRPQTMADEGTGDYILRQVLRNGSTIDLQRLDLHGRHSPPVAIGDSVYSLQDAEGRGLSHFVEGRQQKGFRVWGHEAWHAFPDGSGIVLREFDRGVSCYGAQGELRWHIPRRGFDGRLACASNGGVYILWDNIRPQSYLDEWRPGKRLLYSLREKLRIDDGEELLELVCYDADGELNWQTPVEWRDNSIELLVAGPWLAIASGSDLLLYEIGLGDD